MIIEIVNKIFATSKILTRSENITFYKAQYECLDVEKFKIDVKAHFSNLNDKFRIYGYSWQITSEDLNFSISQDKFNDLDTSIPYDDNPIIDFQIFKKGKNIVIYDKTLFDDFLKKLEYEHFLSALNTIKLPITFINDSGVFYGEKNELEIGNEIEIEKIKELSSQCNYRNYSTYAFTPDVFYLGKDNTKSILEEKIAKLCLVYCLIYISNTSEIKLNKLSLVFSGEKTIKYELDINTDLKLEYLTHYFDIYEWIYSEKTKIEDKIGLSRNILTSYLKKKTIGIDNSAFNSILSANQLYIKGNIKKYFEVRAKLIEQIEDTITRVNKSIDTFFNNFQKNLIVSISYFLSVYIYKITKQNESSRIFNEETIKIGYYFLILSFAFLIVSIIIYCYEKKRLINRYENIKKRYSDVLIKEDLEKILKDDEEYNDEKSFLETRISWYILLWIISIVLFLILLLNI